MCIGVREYLFGESSLAEVKIVLITGRQFCVIFYLGPFFGCIFGPFFGPFLELEYLGLGGVETYDLFKNPFGALFGAFFRALFNDTELTPRVSIQ